jgi:CheY-like chemotaxis protein
MPAAPVILALIPELITTVRVEGGVQRLGGQLRVVETEDAFLKQLASAPALAVIDLGEQGLDIMSVVQACREARVPVLAFGPHADLGRQRDAVRAGVDFVYPRSKFMADPTSCMRGAIAGARAQTT